MKTIATKKIGRFTVEIEPNEDREGVQCGVRCGKAWGSLAVAEDFGEIDACGEVTPVKIPDATLEAIRTYAESFGY